MQFYEELGVPREASPETIKDAYRTMVRLLHPDQQTDPVLKEAAERQMRRLNHLYAVLSDPERRRRYDHDHHDHERPPIIIHAPRPMPPGRSISINMMLWPALAFICIGVVIWLVTHDEAAATRESVVSAQSLADPAPAGASTKPRDPSGTSVLELRSQLRQVIAERDAAQAELARNSARSSRPGSPSPVSKPAVALLAKPIAVPEPPPQQLAAAFSHPVSTPPAIDMASERPVAPELPAALPRFTGAWFYASSGVPNHNPALYPPIFIETMISERGGSLHGRYRARYQISDRAISPDVSFLFEGEPEGTIAHLTFNGQGGARGSVSLKLLTENSMEVRWSASQLGSMGLASGTAILRRRPE